MPLPPPLRWLPHRLLHFFSIYTISMTCQSSKMAALPVVNPIKTDTIHYIPAFYPTNSMMNLTHLERRIVFLVFSNSHTRQLHINISHEVSSLHCSGMNDDQIFFLLFLSCFFLHLFYYSWKNDHHHFSSDKNICLLFAFYSSYKMCVITCLGKILDTMKIKQHNFTPRSNKIHYLYYIFIPIHIFLYVV